MSIGTLTSNWVAFASGRKRMDCAAHEVVKVFIDEVLVESVCPLVS